MSTIQNLKNFIRHGKQARGANAPHGEATTNVSNVHAQQQRHAAPGAPPAQHYAISDPNVLQHQPLQGVEGAKQGDFSAAVLDNRNVAAKAGDVAARAAADAQKAAERKGDIDPSVLERIVAEERASKNKLPKYPGLERWTLVEKMGDGAFSNVYRAKDNTGQYPDVAIKVVRKFEMNSTQVSNCVLFFPGVVFKVFFGALWLSLFLHSCENIKKNSPPFHSIQDEIIPFYSFRRQHAVLFGLPQSSNRYLPF